MGKWEKRGKSKGLVRGVGWGRRKEETINKGERIEGSCGWGVDGNK